MKAEDIVNRLLENDKDIIRRKLGEIDWNSLIGSDDEDEDEEYSDEDPSVFKRSGLDSVFCSGHAVETYAHFGPARAKIFFVSIDNDAHKNAGFVQECDGHDFCVVDDKYVVDFWGWDNGYIDEPVLSMAEDIELIHKMYGDPATWERNQKLEAYAE